MSGHTHHDHQEEGITDVEHAGMGHRDHAGMAVAEHGVAGHHDHPGPTDGPDKHAGHSVAMFRDRFWLSLALTFPVVYFSETIQGWFGYVAPTFTGSDWVAPVLGTAIFLYGGSPFLKGAVQEARHRQPGMMLLIGMAITVAFLASWVTTLFGSFELEFWWELALLITIMLLGHWMEMRAIGQASGALEALAELLPDEAEQIVGAETRVVPTTELNVGDRVLVRPGGRAPGDGLIFEGEAEMNESMVTGESKPVTKKTGDRVVAGTVATDTAIRVEIDAVGDDTALAGIRRLVEQAQKSKSRAQVLADRAAALLFYIAVSAAVVTALAWTVVSQPDQAIVRTVTVLVIACPHALGLAIPLVVSISTGLAAENGILVKDRLALERMRTVDIVLFDKTGTLTKGSHRVHNVFAIDGDTGRMLSLASAVESSSEHPLAKAVVAAADGGSSEASEFRSWSGRGVEAVVEGTRVAVGGPALLREREVDVPAQVAAAVLPWENRGAAVLYILRNNEVMGAVSLEDEIRPESREAMEELHRLGVSVAMITGDADQVAQAVGQDLEIDVVFAEVLPEDKHAKVAELQERGLTVAMVGDGVNDAPALAQADVGIAIGAGTDVAIESAGVVLASDDPRSVVAVRKLSRAGYGKMLQNLAWATGYNVVAIPLAAGVLAWAGIVLGPAVGAALMSASTVIVAVNAQFLRRLNLRSE